MIFFYLNSEKARNLIFFACNCCNMISVGLAGFSGFSKEYLGLLIMATSSCLFNLNKNYKSKSCSLIHSTFYSLSIILPCAFIIYDIKNYQFGVEIGFQIPFRNDIYIKNLFLNILWFAFLNTVSSIVLCIEKKRGKDFSPYQLIKSIKRAPFVILACVVLIVSYVKSVSTLQAFADPSESIGNFTSYITILLSDTVFLVLFSLWVYTYSAKQKVQFLFFLIIAAFSIFDVLFCGSKSSIIKIFNYCYLVPIAFLTRMKDNLIPFPRPIVFVATLSAAFWIFSFSKEYRNQLFDKDTTIINKIENTYYKNKMRDDQDGGALSSMFNKAMIRQSADFDRACKIN